METIYFDGNRGHICSGCAEDLGLKDLPEASNQDEKCVICVFTDEQIAKLGGVPLVEQDYRKGEF